MGTNSTEKADQIESSGKYSAPPFPGWEKPNFDPNASLSDVMKNTAVQIRTPSDEPVDTIIKRIRDAGGNPYDISHKADSVRFQVNVDWNDHNGEQRVCFVFYIGKFIDYVKKDTGGRPPNRLLYSFCRRLFPNIEPEFRVGTSSPPDECCYACFKMMGVPVTINI